MRRCSVDTPVLEALKNAHRHPAAVGADVFADGAANRVRPKSGHVLILEPSSAYFSRARFIFGHAGHSPSLLLDFRKLLAIIPGVLLLTFFVILTF